MISPKQADSINEILSACNTLIETLDSAVVSDETIDALRGVSVACHAALEAFTSAHLTLVGSDPA